MQTLEVASPAALLIAGKPALSPEEKLDLISHRVWLQSRVLPTVMTFEIIIIKFLLFPPPNLWA